MRKYTPMTCDRCGMCANVPVQMLREVVEENPGATVECPRCERRRGLAISGCDPEPPEIGTMRDVSRGRKKS